jgi:hypothetical protein
MTPEQEERHRLYLERVGPKARRATEARAIEQIGALGGTMQKEGKGSKYSVELPCAPGIRAVVDGAVGAWKIILVAGTYAAWVDLHEAYGPEESRVLLRPEHKGEALLGAVLALADFRVHFLKAAARSEESRAEYERRAEQEAHVRDALMKIAGTS